MDISSSGRYVALNGSENFIYDLINQKIEKFEKEKIDKTIFLSNHEFVTISSKKKKETLTFWKLGYH